VLLYSTAGVHPHDAKVPPYALIRNNLTEANLKTWDKHTRCAIEGLLSKKEVVVVGECGLDFDRNFSPQDVQKDCFIQQLEIASAVNKVIRIYLVSSFPALLKLLKPLFLHERAASEAFLTILNDYRARTSSSTIPPGTLMSGIHRKP